MKRGGSLRRTPMPSRKAPLSRGTGLARTPSEPQARLGSGVQPKRPARAIPFPPKVAALLDARDKWCQRCGSPGPLHRHHRRAKGKGGSRRTHTQCPCNGVGLCEWLCHPWAHANPEQARAEGWIVSQSVDEPGRVSVMRGSADGGGAAMYPHCDGTWREYEPDRSAE